MIPSHRFVHGRGGRLHQLDYGGDGRPVVCLHGVTGHASVWSAVARHLGPAEHRVVAADLRGHGDSQWSATADYGTAAHAHDLLDLLDGWGLPSASLVGSSWGGLVAIEFARRHPDRVRKLAVLDIQPSFTQSSNDVPERPAGFARHGDAVAWERTANPRADDELVETMAERGYRPGADGLLVRKHDPFFARHWPFRDEDHWSSLPELRVPALLLHAQHTFVSAEAMRRMAEQIPDARLVEVPDSGHVIPVEAPKAVAEHLTAFLDG